MKHSHECIEELRVSRPDVAITIERELDPYFSWDGDGPDPRDEGYSPYTVTVMAIAIRNGELLTGDDSLGGCYYRPNEPIDDVHGYLPQMVEEAVDELNAQIDLANGGGFDASTRIHTALADAGEVAGLRGAPGQGNDPVRTCPCCVGVLA
jgi:hypothetical protein